MYIKLLRYTKFLGRFLKFCPAILFRHLHCAQDIMQMSNFFMGCTHRSTFIQCVWIQRLAASHQCVKKNATLSTDYYWNYCVVYIYNIYIDSISVTMEFLRVMRLVCSSAHSELLLIWLSTQSLIVRFTTVTNKIIKFDNYDRLFFLGICVALKRAVYSVRWELK